MNSQPPSWVTQYFANPTKATTGYITTKFEDTVFGKILQTTMPQKKKTITPVEIKQPPQPVQDELDQQQQEEFDKLYDDKNNEWIKEEEENKINDNLNQVLTANKRTYSEAFEQQISELAKRKQLKIQQLVENQSLKMMKEQFKLLSKRIQKPETALTTLTPLKIQGFRKFNNANPDKFKQPSQKRYYNQIKRTSQNFFSKKQNANKPG